MINARLFSRQAAQVVNQRLINYELLSCFFYSSGTI
jgi:hypothetical protein